MTNKKLQEEWDLYYSLGSKEEANSYIIQRLIEIVDKQVIEIKSLKQDIRMLNKGYRKKEDKDNK